jgi:Methyltransferase domain
VSIFWRLAPRQIIRTFRNAIFDLKYGGFSGGYRPNHSPGAHGTGATDYSLMPQFFTGRVSSSDVLVDVGCGTGRVINYWLSQGIHNPIIGLEMLEEVANVTRSRLKGYANVSIVTGDAIDHLPAEGTLYFLFNPFDETVLSRFQERLLKVASQPVRIIYFAPTHLNVFLENPLWKVEQYPVQLPKAGFFEERHKTYAVITSN